VLPVILYLAAQLLLNAVHPIHPIINRLAPRPPCHRQGTTAIDVTSFQTLPPELPNNSSADAASSPPPLTLYPSPTHRHLLVVRLNPKLSQRSYTIVQPSRHRQTLPPELHQIILPPTLHHRQRNNILPITNPSSSPRRTIKSKIIAKELHHRPAITILPAARKNNHQRK